MTPESHIILGQVISIGDTMDSGSRVKTLTPWQTPHPASVEAAKVKSLPFLSNLDVTHQNSIIRFELGWVCLGGTLSAN